MKLIVLGNYGTFPGKDGACSGYLLKERGLNILIDCGNGVLSKLQRYCKIEDLDAIILSHLHRDHTSDMYVLKYAIETKFAYGTMKKAIDVYAPITPRIERRGLNYMDVYNLYEIGDNIEVDIKDKVHVKFFKMKHSVESYGIRVESRGKVFAYSGDTSYNKNIENLAQNADLFLCEATGTESMNSIAPIPHLSPKIASEIAVNANVKKLVLTHFWFEEPRENYYKEASSIFSKVILSNEGDEYRI